MTNHRVLLAVRRRGIDRDFVGIPAARERFVGHQGFLPGLAGKWVGRNHGFASLLNFQSFRRAMHRRSGANEPATKAELKLDFFCNGPSVVNPSLALSMRYPIAEHLLLYGVGARPPPDGVR